MAASTIDTTFLYNYKGVLYPLDLASDGFSSDTSHQASSLLQLCSEKIVMDSSSTKRALQAAPIDICHSLMRAALSLARDRAIEVLISNWPYPTLSLRKFAPPLFRDLGVLYDDDCIVESMRRGVKYTTSLAHTFVECLKKRSPTKLKCLDLTGFPAAEVIVNYLSSHVLLGYNESRQRDIISMYNSVVENLPEHQQVALDCTLPEDNYVIHLDACLQTTDTYMELCRALKSSQLDRCLFRLVVQRLDLTCLGVARICVLLEQITNQCLRGLSIQHNGLSLQAMMILAPALQHLQSLNALDLSCNPMNVTHNDNACEALCKALSNLPYITRLDLSGMRIRGRLSRLLSGIQRPLDFLRLCGCGLNFLDITYLTRSHHVNGLQELDLSENQLMEPRELYRQFLDLLDHLAPKLTVLELEDISSEGANHVDIFKACSTLHNVRFLNLANMQALNEDTLLCSVKHLVAMRGLEVVRLSYPAAVYTADDEAITHSMKAIFTQLFTQITNNMCYTCNRRRFKVVLI